MTPVQRLAVLALTEINRAESSLDWLPGLHSRPAAQELDGSQPPGFWVNQLNHNTRPAAADRSLSFCQLGVINQVSRLWWKFSLTTRKFNIQHSSLVPGIFADNNCIGRPPFCWAG